MKATLFAAAYAGFLLFGLLQIAATADGLQHLTGLWKVLCCCAAVLVGWMPVVGTALGIYGAHTEWGWGLAASVAVFVGVPLLFLHVLTASLWAASRDTSRGVALPRTPGSEHQG